MALWTIHSVHTMYYNTVNTSVTTFFLKSSFHLSYDMLISQLLFRLKYMKQISISMVEL